jgi:hypothetical protein
MTLGRLILIGAMVATGLSGCTLGDGEGPRYIGRVHSVTSSQVCVGPSTSSDRVTCGSAPDEFSPLPRVGQCVGLFPAKVSDGAVVSWSEESLRLHYEDGDCSQRR